jgi:hypothetical protein
MGSADAIVMSRNALWDFLDDRLKNVMVQWIKDDKLTKRDCAILNQKIKRLSQEDFDLAIKTKLLAGPIHKHVYKMRMKGAVQLRPMLCRGPISIEFEYTFLLGSVETGGKLPAGSKEKASARRDVVANNVNRRTAHMRFPEGANEGISG